MLHCVRVADKLSYISEWGDLHRNYILISPSKVKIIDVMCYILYKCYNLIVGANFRRLKFSYYTTSIAYPSRT
jgi:hypothetical protein